MDIYIIENTIEDLENGEITLDTISKLADLYIVRDSLSKNNEVENELDDILPAYKEYLHIKKQYQMKEISEGAVIKSIKYLCEEIIEFLNTLYNCTDMNKERKCLKDMINTIYLEFKSK